MITANGCFWIGPVLERSRMQTTPFRWSLLDSLIPREPALVLSREFPSVGFHVSRREAGSNKTYTMKKRAVLAPVRGVEPDVSDLSPTWLELFDELRAPGYFGAIERLAGFAIDPGLMDITFTRHAGGCFVSPHVDHEEKAMTQLIYFNDEWNPSWGGCLRILTERRINACVAEIAPRLGTLALIVRSDHSWHAVTEVDAQVDRERCALEIGFWRERPLHHPGRIDAKT